MKGFDQQVSKSIEAIYGTPDVAAQRARILQVLRPAPGERVADLGCGPGHLVADLCAAVGPEGLVHGLDLSPDMVALARQRAAAHPNGRIAIGEVRALPFADAAFDAVASIQVLEYVPRVEAAITEMARVLRPGGRAAVMATDWESLVLETADWARLARIVATWTEHGAHPHLPSRLGPLLRDAGLQVAHVEALPMLSSRYDRATYAVGILDLVHRFARKHGDPEDADGFMQEQRTLGRQDRFFFCLNRFLFLAERG